MIDQNAINLTEEEIFRIKTLVETWGMDEGWILEKLEDDREVNCSELDKCDVSASMMWDCHIDTKLEYKRHLGLLPYQVWNSFRNTFENWLEGTERKVYYRDMIKELVLPNKQYRDYFCKYGFLNKYINRLIDEHNELHLETLDNKAYDDSDLPF